MSEGYFINKEFKGIDSTQLEKGEYEDCVFINCDFSETNFSNFTFIECQFEQCDLSNTNLTETAFRDVITLIRKLKN